MSGPKEVLSLEKCSLKRLKKKGKIQKLKSQLAQKKESLATAEYHIAGNFRGAIFSCFLANE